uniref:hypothetical protein n=1 Tax=uncultured Erythrobacter sp. TaxID=263913 RepID=UPI00263721EA|nr:hypothetical protein [uncultured Erythrobacter sp.]
MKHSIFIAVVATALLTACSAETGTNDSSSSDDPHAGHHMGPSKEAAREKAEFVEVFVDHFDAQECKSSELIGTMQRKEPDGSGLYIRSYQTSPSCVDDLKTVFETRGFDEFEAGRYISETDDGTTERVVIRMADDGSRAGVEWEVEKE